MSTQNGTPAGADVRETVIGINLGNSYASIAVITKVRSWTLFLVNMLMLTMILTGRRG